MQKDPVFARCAKPERAECQRLQEIKRPVKERGKLKNLCMYCRSPLEAVSKAEVREYLIQQSILNSRKDRYGK